MSTTVLVVDDDRSVRDSLIRLLGARGYRPVGAADGLEAVQRALDEPPAVITMDMHMPNANGVEATRRIQAHASLKHVPVIALCAIPPVSDEERSLFTRILLKPCRPAEILEAIEQAIGGD